MKSSKQQSKHPILLTPAQLKSQQNQLVLVDVRGWLEYWLGHIPGARRLTQNRILKDIPKDQAIRLPARARHIHVLAGGPVETTRGFVFHSADYALGNSTVMLAENIGMTVTLDILRAIARGDGPETAVLALGYASWGPGQLESELQSNSWLHGPAEHDILFGDEHDNKYDKALKSIGIDPVFLIAEAGHG